MSRVLWRSGQLLAFRRHTRAARLHRPSRLACSARATHLIVHALRRPPTACSCTRCGARCIDEGRSRDGGGQGERARARRRGARAGCREAAARRAASRRAAEQLSRARVGPSGGRRARARRARSRADDRRARRGSGYPGRSHLRLVIARTGPYTYLSPQGSSLIDGFFPRFRLLVRIFPPVRLFSPPRKLQSVVTGERAERCARSGAQSTCTSRRGSNSAC